MKIWRGFWLGLRYGGVVAVLLAGAPLATAQVGDAEYTALWGPAVGSAVPMLAANDQNGQARDLASLTGDSGLLLVFNRSVDW